MNRFETALQIQEGASNRRLVSRKLHEAIVEVSDAGGDPDSDPAVFLILHQLAFLLTGMDVCCADERLHRRWLEATAECVTKSKEVTP